MSELQLVLLFVGAIIIFAVIAFNWWQERKFKSEATRRFETPETDVLMESEFHFDDSAIATDDEPQPSLHQEKVFVELPPEMLDETPTTVADTPEMRADEPGLEAAAPEVADAEAGFDMPDDDFTTQDEMPDDVVNDDDVSVSVREMDETAQPEEAVTEAPGIIRPPDGSGLSAEIDPRVDLIAVLYLPQAVDAVALRAFALPAEIDKPCHVHGLGEDGLWYSLAVQPTVDRVTRVTCSMQLADRAGAVAKGTLSRFQHAVDQLGRTLGAQVEWQPGGDPGLAADELDQFCIDVDKTVGFHLVRGDSGPFTGTKFRGLVEARGLVLGADGAFHCEDDAGQRLFSVVNRDALPFSPEMLRISVIHGVTFQLDIPRVKNCTETFNQMVLAARQMAGSLGAHLIDDHQHPLDEAQIEKIRQQLKVIYAKMTARGIIPGSAPALRLFS